MIISTTARDDGSWWVLTKLSSLLVTRHSKFTSKTQPSGTAQSPVMRSVFAAGVSAATSEKWPKIVSASSPDTAYGDTSLDIRYRYTYTLFFVRVRSYDVDLDCITYISPTSVHSLPSASLLTLDARVKVNVTTWKGPELVDKNEILFLVGVAEASTRRRKRHATKTSNYR